LRVLICGASGFIGSHLTAFLSKNGFEVFALSRETSSHFRIERLSKEYYHNLLSFPPPTFIQLQINKNFYTKLKKYLITNKIDVVINTISYGVDYNHQDLIKAEFTNISLASEILKIAGESEVKLYIHLGSSQEYGAQANKISEDSILMPTNLYGVTKAKGSESCLEISKKYNMKFVIFRLFSIYGPLENSEKFLPKLIHSLKNKESIDLTWGDQKRDYLFIEDLCKIISEAISLQKLIKFDIYNIASSKVKTIKDIAKIAVEATLADDTLLKWGKIPYRKNEIMNLEVSTERIFNLIKLEQSTSLHKGISILEKFI
jgi:nucleoside-diphosphate-sugar epimerase